MWTSQPSNAWIKHLFKASQKAKWIEDSKKISDSIPLSKRELFTLVILAHLQNSVNDSNSWRVGYDFDASEPNDGLITTGKSRIDIEHKLVPQMAREEVLKAILDTYEKYAKRGEAYGSGRTLIIYGNKQTQGLIKISSLRDQINNKCPFDRVLLMHAVSMKENGTTAVIHISEHYPGNSMAQVDFNLLTGKAEVPYNKLAI